MNYKKIIIFQYEILFDILFEIKEKLNFDLVHTNEIKNLTELKKDLDDDYLVISKSQSFDEKDNLLIDNLPIRIEKLIELINLKFLKKKFNSQSNIIIQSYQLNLNSRKISKNKISLDLTEREINLIIFLNKSITGVNINTLQKEVWEYSPELDTHTVETHIYRLRKKIKETFDDSSFIVSTQNGYKIN